MQVSHYVNSEGKFVPEYPGQGESSSKAAEKTEDNGDTTTPSNTSNAVTYRSIKESPIPLTTAIICQFFYSITALLLAFSCVVIGATLALNSISADTKWVIDIVGFKSELNSTSQGIVIAIIGLCVAWLGRFEVSLNESKSNK